MTQNWIYCSELYRTKFQAGVLAKRLEEDWWIMQYKSPQEVEIFKTRSGKFGVRYNW